MTNMTKKELISLTKKRYLKAEKKDKGGNTIWVKRKLTTLSAGKNMTLPKRRTGDWLNQNKSADSKNKN